MTEEYTVESLDDLFREAEEVKPADIRRKPFKFLDPYAIEDRDIFFGRDIEISETYSRFYRSRILLVYGESGSGKTSLIQCGLRSEIPAEDIQFITVRSAINPLESLRKELLKIASFPENITALSCADLLEEAVFQKSKTIGLIFDQFEEFFIFQPKSVRDEFILELTDWLAKDLNLRIIICIREEYLARMTEMEGFIPQLYQNRLWVRRMSREQAQEVIIEPCRKCGVGIETELGAELLDVMTRGGKGVELPILQVVLDTLYQKAVEISLESPNLTLAAYQDMGKIESILARFIEDKISSHPNPEPARQILKAMVTSEGTRRVSSKTELAENAAQFGEPIPETDLDAILNRLIDDRIIREDADNRLFELRHDTLAHIIRQWMTGIEQELMEVRQTIENRFKEFQTRGTLLDVSTLKYIAPYESRLKLKPALAEFIEKSKKEAQRKRKRLMAIVGSAVAVFVLVVSGLGIFGYVKSVEAEKQKMRAEEKTLTAEKNALQTIKALNQAANALFLTHDGLGALLTGVKSVKMTKQINISLCPKYETVSDLLKIFYSLNEIYEVNRLIGHQKQVYGVAFSPDGKILASGDGEGLIKVWNMENGREIGAIKTHETIKNMDFSLNGKILAWASGTTVRLWNIEECKEINVLKNVLEGHEVRVFSVSFSPDGKTLASGGSDGRIKLWDITDGKEIITLKLHSSPVWGICFSPDGKTIASGSEDGEVKLLSVDDGREIKTLQGIMPKSDIPRANSIWSVHFSPDGKILASAGGDGKVGIIKLWNVSDGVIKMLEGHSGSCMCAIFSPDGKALASAGFDGTIKLWSMPDGEEIKTLYAHSGAISWVDFTPDGNMLASGSLDATVKIWQIGHKKKQQGISLLRHSSPVHSVAFSPDGKMIAAGNGVVVYPIYRDSMVRLWNIATGELIQEIESSKPVQSVQFSPDGKLLAFSDDTIIRLLDTKEKKETIKLTGHDDYIKTLSFSPDGKTLASGGRSCIKIWNIEDGKERHILKGDIGSVNSLSFSPDGQILASGGNAEHIIFWNFKQGNEIRRLTGHEGSVHTVTFSPNGKLLASGSDDRTIRLWNTADGKEICQLKGHSAPVLTVCFSPDGTILASGSSDKTIRFWNVTDEKELYRIERHKDSIESLCFSPDGKILTSASSDNTVRLWNSELDDLLIDACECLQTFLKYNPNVSEEDRYLCDDVLKSGIVSEDNQRLCDYIEPQVSK